VIEWKAERKPVVVALGGNAILQPGQEGTFEEQMANVHVTCEQLAHMVESGKYRIVVTHGERSSGRQPAASKRGWQGSG